MTQYTNNVYTDTFLYINIDITQVKFKKNIRYQILALNWIFDIDRIFFNAEFCLGICHCISLKDTLQPLIVCNNCIFQFDLI